MTKIWSPKAVAVHLTPVPTVREWESKAILTLPIGTLDQCHARKKACKTSLEKHILKLSKNIKMVSVVRHSSTRQTAWITILSSSFKRWSNSRQVLSSISWRMIRTNTSLCFHISTAEISSKVRLNLTHPNSLKKRAKKQVKTAQLHRNETHWAVSNSKKWLLPTRSNQSFSVTKRRQMERIGMTRSKLASRV